MPTVVSEPPVAERARHLSYPRMMAINAFWLGNGAHWQPITGSLLPVGAALLVGTQHQNSLVGQVTAAGGVFALLVPIGVGYLSDRTTSRFGRRRPWMVGGTIFNVLGLLLIALAWAPAALIGLYLLLQASNNVAGAAYSGVIPDVVPAEERGRASGLLGTMNSVGTVLGLLAVFVILDIFKDTRIGLILSYATIAIIFTTTLVITCWGTPEVPLAPRQRQPIHVTRTAALFSALLALSVVGILALLVASFNGLTLAATAVMLLATLAVGMRLPALMAFVVPFQHRDFLWVFLTRFLVQLGIFSIVPFIESYFQEVVHAGGNSGAQSSLWLLAVLGGGMVPAIVGGTISDRIGRRKIFVYVSGAIQGAVVSVLLFGLVSSLLPLYILGVIYGVGYGTYYSVDWALACDVLPARGADAGKDMSLWHISFTLPQVLAPALLGGLIDYLNSSHHAVLGMATGHNLGFRLVFGTAALWFALGTLMVSRIRGVR